MLTLSFNNIIVNLPSPEFGDKLASNYRKIVSRTRGNELFVSGKMGFINLNSIKTYHYSISYIDEPTKQQLLNFLASTVGQVITVNTDYDDNLYNGIIMSPSVDIVQPVRGGSSVDLEIQMIDPVIGSPIMIQGLHGNKMVTQGYGL